LNPDSDIAFEWDAPSPPATVDYTGKLVAQRFKTLAEYQQATGQDAHSVPVGFDVFRNVAEPDKSDPQRLYDPENLDFTLKPGSAASAAGADLPTITDGLHGNAPDLGAYPTAASVPHYGPRGSPAGEPGPEAPRSLRGP
jgi:hypothetical protein